MDIFFLTVTIINDKAPYPNQVEIYKVPLITSRTLPTISWHLDKKKGSNMDTIKVGFQGVKPDVLQSNGCRDWSMQSNQATGEIISQKVIIPLNMQGEKYLGTVGITYNYTKGFLMVNVSSAPVLLYGTSLKRVQSVDVPKLIDKLNETVAPYLKVTLNGAALSRYDSSTLFDDLSAPAETFINYLDVITRAKVYHAHKVLYQGEYLQFRTKTNACGFYDKNGKAKDNEIERQMMVDLDTLDTSPLRWEVQNPHSKAIRKIKEAGIILDDLKTDQVQGLFIKQRKTMFDRYFKFTSDVKKCDNFFDAYNYLKPLRPRAAINDACWLVALKDCGVTPAMMEVAMVGQRQSREGIRKNRKKAAELLSMTIPERDLFHELKTAIHNDNEL